jgi:hypothetical protein
LQTIESRNGCEQQICSYVRQRTSHGGQWEAAAQAARKAATQGNRIAYPQICDSRSTRADRLKRKELPEWDDIVAGYVGYCARIEEVSAELLARHETNMPGDPA